MEPGTESFFWPDTEEILLAAPDLRWAPADQAFVGRERDGGPVRVTLPLNLPVPEGIETAADLTRRGPIEPGPQLVVLMQAGAIAMGWFELGESVRTKSDKKYVVRGKGKAQPTHLSTKGKSRYGSRLRLQNARALLDETDARIRDWQESHGPPEHVFYSCPVRLWADFLKLQSEPPIDGDAAIRIPYDLAVPTTDVLLRCYKKMSYGRIERAELS